MIFECERNLQILLKLVENVPPKVEFVYHLEGKHCALSNTRSSWQYEKDPKSARWMDDAVPMDGRADGCLCSNTVAFDGRTDGRTNE